jgi:hypothetical protein
VRPWRPERQEILAYPGHARIAGKREDEGEGQQMTPWRWFASSMLRRLIAAGGSLALLASLAAAFAAPAAAATAGDRPPGYWYGTDSFPVTVTGSAPYREPVLGGAYGGYMGMIGNWARWQGCGDKLAWSAANSAQADTDLTKYGRGVGTGTYWFMGGPGVDPHYNGTTAEAYRFGQEQAQRALADIGATKYPYPVLFLDVELPGNAPGISPAPDNGWNSVYTSPCSGKTRSSFVAANVDRADFNGFAAYLTSHSGYKAGVYSSPSVWAGIFGSGSAAALSGVYEWTYSGGTSSLSHHPAGWCLPGTSTCADFFGGVSRSSSDAVMWQWSGGGGTGNGIGDFDQIDARTIH